MIRAPFRIVRRANTPRPWIGEWRTTYGGVLRPGRVGIAIFGGTNGQQLSQHARAVSPRALTPTPIRTSVLLPYRVFHRRGPCRDLLRAAALVRLARRAADRAREPAVLRAAAEPERHEPAAAEPLLAAVRHAPAVRGAAPLASVALRAAVGSERRVPVAAEVRHAQRAVRAAAPLASVALRAAVAPE